MGGIRKTTLARKVFNNPKIQEHFEKRMWVCVSDDFNANRLFRLMLESLKEPMPDVETREARVNRLKELLDCKKYLLVLDDVWNKESTLWNGFLGSLRDDQCWLILKENAFGTGEVPNRLQHLGVKIAQRCRGLPLAASVLSGMLRNKGTAEWETLESRLQSLGCGENSGIAEILKLSFDHLPYPSLKKCFAYCSIFPKDFQMERNQLIQLWVAEGFLHSNQRNNMCMEEVGNMYFTILLDSNLFQDAMKDEYGNVLNCKMHDLVHDMVQSISNSKTLRLTESGSDDKEKFPIQYLELERSEKEMPFPSSERFKCITTLFLLEDKSLNDREISFFMLRVLSLRSSSVKKLPKTLAKLTHLRYLDLSRISIKTMPDSLCQLYNLQTLRVEDCESLIKFPNNFKNLVNLRHFELQNCTNYKELPTLGHMPSLRSLHLVRLNGITSIGPSFYGESALHSGTSNQSPPKLFPALKHFILRDMENLIEWIEAIVDDRTVVVFPILEMIEIEDCESLTMFPNNFTNLVKLKHFEVQNYGNCKELPTLGHMPFLCSLHLEGLDGITNIWPSFYGGSTMHGGSSSQSSLELFPALKHFILRRMKNLTKWMEAKVHDREMMVFPSLETIEIEDCPELATFPSLQKLHISETKNGSAVMEYICN
ncbi:putative disease resistance protein RGA4 [Coffea arabica]|uniref:Disease resistance protein RGA4 n=1 Tax=Coffea arabica TaxID=13443 RepID=A0A6P6UEQ9_COFAR|nr:putative disease resistance protein RGA3 [Coffea arabica]